MSVSRVSPLFTALASAALGLCAAAPAQAAWLFGRLVPGAPEVQANHDSSEVDVSHDGKTFVFNSGATNWLAGQTLTPGSYAIAIDADTGLIEVVSRTTAGVLVRGEGPSVSRDGRYVAFLSNTGDLGVSTPHSGWQVARKDRSTGQLRLVSANAAGTAGTGNDDNTVSISDDGRYVAFASASQNFGATLPDSWYQIFVKDMDSGQVVLASVRSDGTPPPSGCSLAPQALSGDGRHVVFICSNPLWPNAGSMQVYVRDLVQNTTEIASRANGAGGATSTAFSGYPSISPNGRFVTFTNPIYGGLGGTSGTHSGVYLRDRTLQTTVSIPRPDVPNFSSCSTTAVSNIATVLMECNINGRSQVFLYVPGTGSTPVLISSNSSGAVGNAPSGYSLAMDAAGLSMAFESAATDLVAGDTNGRSDIFVLLDSNVIDGLFRDGFED